ncbi:hypothetical protein CKC_04580 [Candidatus Liberibacter solanacearum CLso-ZC1]|uniref:Lipoprotein n=1 Tax=Liberibacter solanacearum (strain CLso-ZC1) TaxID=658172 RepID=E4UDI7_LIBSC|nr:hypothetical protein [Candidatus Liberibacter solanacearum]ADR52665.1 hypothetical protein CKC_04580 [Candidatus Liberibacter solanacearum CLso-ZC1]
MKISKYKNALLSLIGIALTSCGSSSDKNDNDDNKLPLFKKIPFAYNFKQAEQSSSSNQPLSPGNTNPTPSEDQSKSETSSSSPDSPEEKSTPSS